MEDLIEKIMYNLGPIFIDFGRRPSWNCAKDSEVPDDVMEVETDKFDDQFDERLEAQEDNPKKHLQAILSQGMRFYKISLLFAVM